MKILIVEDEIQAIKRLESVINNLNEAQDYNIIDKCKSVKETERWFQNNKMPDLVFLDIQLSDGLSFEIFKTTNITCPIIFVTAYNNYAIEAFKVNSIDYILKPYHANDIKKSLNKYKNLKGKNIDSNLLKTLYDNLKTTYKSRFFAKINNTIYSIPVDEIQFFKFEDAAIVLVNNENKMFVINYSLDALEDFLDPKIFFRINRRFIIHINSIVKMNIYSKSRISVILKNETKEIVSRSKSNEFRNWLNL